MNFSLPRPVPRPELLRPAEAVRAIRTRNRLLALLSPATMVNLQPRLQPVELAQGEVLHEPARPMSYGYFVDSGMIACQAVMGNGRAISVSLIGPEGFAGFAGISGVGPGALRLIAQIPTQVQRVAFEDLKRVAATSYQLQVLLLRSLQLQHSDSAQMAACNSVHEVPCRLSRWILAVQDRVLLTQATPEEALPLTHELLSEMLGASRSTVSLAAESLKRAGLISYSRGNIHVINRKGLEKSACECYEIGRALLNEYLAQH